MRKLKMFGPSRYEIVLLVAACSAGALHLKWLL